MSQELPGMPISRDEKPVFDRPQSFGLEVDLPAHTWLPDRTPFASEPVNLSGEKPMLGAVPAMAEASAVGVHAGSSVNGNMMPMRLGSDAIAMAQDDSMGGGMMEPNNCAPPAAFEAKPSVDALTAHYTPLDAPWPGQGESLGGDAGECSGAQRGGHALSLPMEPGGAMETFLGLSSSSVVRPDRNQLPRDMEIHVHGVPARGAKSRVETQIRMRLELVSRAPHTGEGGQPVWERIGSFSHIKVPPLSGTKRKSKKHRKLNVPMESMLHLDATVINATPPHAHVYVCDSCRERERKRAHRKKTKKLSPCVNPTEDEIRALGIDPHAPNAMELAASRMEEEERRHAVLFNCGDYIDFYDGEAVLSTRITCYCRHHREKLGFCIVFTLRNDRGEFIATGTTPPIMIMDDHKSIAQSSTLRGGAERMRSVDGTLSQSSMEPNADELVARVSSPKGGPHPGVDVASDALARARDRAKPYEDNCAMRRRIRGSRDNGHMVDPAGTSFFLDSSRNYMWNSMAMHEVAQTTPAPPAAAPQLTSPSGWMHPMERVVPTSPSVADSIALLGSSVDGAPVRMSPDYAVPLDAVNAPREEAMRLDAVPVSPDNGMRLDSVFAPRPTATPQTAQAALPLAAPSLAAPPLPQPKITKMIPAEGPTTGGIEITILGENFTEGIQCMFGDTPSTYTRVWASTTLVCILPPRFRPGPVMVSLHKPPMPPTPAREDEPLHLFTYIDATDRALMELALQVVGLQMMGQMASARDVAMRIVNSQSGKEGGAGAGAAGAACDAVDTASHAVAWAAARESSPVSALLASARLRSGGAMPTVQDLLIEFLALLDVPSGGPPLSTPPIHACNSRCHTLLHLAVFLGLRRLVDDLLNRGCPVNARDVNGYTALHFAAMYTDVPIVEALLRSGASLSVRTDDGLLPVDVSQQSQTPAVAQVLAGYAAGSAAAATPVSPCGDGISASERSADGASRVDDADLLPADTYAAADVDADDEADETDDDDDDDGMISFSELAAGYRPLAQTPGPSRAPSPRIGWGFLGGLAPRRTCSPDAVANRPALANLAHASTSSESPAKDDSNQTQPAKLDCAGMNMDRKPQLSSPPPTYDEATLEDESGTSRHLFGEKLVTEPSKATSARLRSARWSAADEEAAKQSTRLQRAVKLRGSSSTGSARVTRTRSGRHVTQTEGRARRVRQRTGLYDDLVLIWFWIPATVAIVLATAALNMGYLSREDPPSDPSSSLPLRALGLVFALGR
ncbi:hypothetical protein MSPP1_002528 [Malassezia sp. CBS 17886]|nr:hypothetical protein MSPP1_002528 [Malassezia sp. CBS 17886]